MFNAFEPVLVCSLGVPGLECPKVSLNFVIADVCLDLGHLPFFSYGYCSDL